MVVFYTAQLPNINGAGTALTGGSIVGGQSSLSWTLPWEKADTDDAADTPDAVVSAVVLTAAGANVDDVTDNDNNGGVLSVITRILDVPEDTTSVRVTAEFNDAYLRSISGNIEFTVTPTDEAPNVAFKGGGTSRTEFSSSIAGFDVINLPKEGAMRVPLQVTLLPMPAH